MENSRSGFFEILRADMRAMGIPRTGILSMMRCFFERTDFCAVFMFRCSSALAKKGKLGRAAALFFWRLNVIVNGCEISSRAVIGEGFSLPHPAGVVIGRVIIGRNVEIYQNATLGQRRRDITYEGPQSNPQIGDNVNIYAGAVIVGSVKIGEGAQIGANSLVLSDVPENCIVMGVPARVTGLATHPNLTLLQEDTQQIQALAG